MNYNYPFYPNSYGYQQQQNYGNQPSQNYQPYQNYQQNYQQNDNQNGFIGVANEEEARMYPVALGKSLTFRDESKPHTYYTKTMGNNPLDRPIFERYRLVKDEPAVEASEATESRPKEKEVDLSAYVLKTDLQPFEGDIAAIKKDIAMLKERTKKKILREVDPDDE